MYIYLSSFAKSKSKPRRWIDVDLSETSLEEIFKSYTDIWLILTSTILNQNVPYEERPVKISLELNLLRSELSGIDKTVNQWLAGLDGEALPTIEGEKTLTREVAKFSDAWRANYQIHPSKIGVHHEVELPESEQRDLLMTRDDLDYKKLYDHCLVSVNGFIHQTSYSENGLYIKDGNFSGQQANDNQVGIISFLDIGKLTPVPITESMLYNPNEEGKLSDSVTVDLKRDLTGKTVLLVLGGYLHVLDGTYSQVGECTFRINTANLPLPQRLYDSMEGIDITSLGLSFSPRNERQVSVEELFSDNTIAKYLQLSQTFFVIVDADHMFVNEYSLQETKIHGRYVSFKDPVYPLKKEDGLMLDYVSFKEEDRWSISVRDTLRSNYNFNTTDYKNQNSIDSKRSTIKPFTFAKGFFLEIGKETI